MFSYGIIEILLRAEPSFKKEIISLKQNKFEKII